MKIHGFREMYLRELQELQSVETQLGDAFPSMKELVSDDTLKQVIAKHLDGARPRLNRLNQLLKQHGADPEQHEDQSMTSLIAESQKWAKMLDNPDLRDAGLISSVQKIAHYRIAAYGTLACWAKHLNFDEDRDVLGDILNQDKAFDAELSRLAKRDVNPDAL